MSMSTFILRNSLISVYTICHSQLSDRHVLPFSVWSGSTLFAILSLKRVYTICQQSEQCLHYLQFSAVWLGSTLFPILCSLIRFHTICHSQKSDQGQGPLSSWETVLSGSTLFAILSNWSWWTLFPILSKQYYHDLHCLPFFLSSFIKIYTVCHFQLSDQCLHYQLFSAVWSGSTLFPILSRLIKVYIICHSEQSVQGLHYLPFSAFLSRSTLFAILSNLISVYTICHSQPSDRHVLPFSVWSGSTLSAILSLKRVKTKCHSQQSNQGLHYLPFSLSSIIRVYTVSHSQLSDQGLHYLLFSAVWSGSTLFAILSTLIRVFTISIFSILFRVYTICHSQQSDQGLHYLPLSVLSGFTLFSLLSSLIKVYTICHS